MDEDESTAASTGPTPGAADPVDGATAAADAVAGGPAIPSAHPVLVYTALRIVLLLVVAGVLYLLQARGIWLILLSFLISGVISGVALSRRREGAAYGITRAVRSVGSRIDASARAEDVDDDSDFAVGSTDAPGAGAPAADGTSTDPTRPGG